MTDEERIGRSPGMPGARTPRAVFGDRDPRTARRVAAPGIPGGGAERAGATLPLPDFIARIEAARSSEAIWKAALDFFRSRGVRMVSYHYYGGPDGEPVIRADGFPADWVNHYVEDKLFRVDPIPELAARSTTPFFWSDTATLTALLDTQAAYLEELRAARLGEGLGVPVFGPPGCDGYVGLGFGGERPALAPHEVRELQLAAQAGHLVYCAMRAGDRQARTALSLREREVLHWIARGKSNSVISDIMGVSPHTVDTHVRRIFDKLGVTDRTSAAIKGLGAGLLMAGPAAPG
jgi:LuxR family transcriptional regulator/LuxR family quorum-sensing system transcriptional regulator CciR